MLLLAEGYADLFKCFNSEQSLMFPKRNDEVRPSKGEPVINTRTDNSNENLTIQRELDIFIHPDPSKGPQRWG